MSYKTNKSKSNIQKIIAIVCILLIVVIWIIVFFATRNKNNNANTIETDTDSAVVTTTSPITDEETTTEITYDYDMKIDLAKVKEAHDENPDVVGWVYIDDTPIDYPIVKGKDNDQYLHKDWKGNDAYAGCIFEDYRCDINKDENTLIYGHNMASGAMFHAIKNYKDEDWAKDHLFVEVATLKERYLYEVFACDVLNGLEGADFEYWNFIQMNENDYGNFLTNIKKGDGHDLHWYAGQGVNNNPKFDDHLLTLQTCDTGDNDGIRCCAFAKYLGTY